MSPFKDGSAGPIADGQELPMALYAPRRAGELAPLTLERPYRVGFTMRSCCREEFVHSVKALDRPA